MKILRNAKDKIYAILSLLGFVALILMIIWFFSLILYTYGEMKGMGIIAFIPKKIFLLSPLSVLLFSPRMERIIEKILEVFFINEEVNE